MGRRIWSSATLKKKSFIEKPVILSKSFVTIDLHSFTSSPKRSDYKMDLMLIQNCVLILNNVLWNKHIE